MTCSTTKAFESQKIEKIKKTATNAFETQKIKKKIKKPTTKFCQILVRYLGKIGQIVSAFETQKMKRKLQSLVRFW